MTTASRSDKKIAARFDSPQQEVYLHLWRTYDRLKALEDELFSQHQLSAQQYNALRLLQLVHPDTVPTLALGAKLVSRAPDISRLLDKLANRGLIIRDRRPENRRVVQVGITPAGMNLLRQLEASVRQCHQRQLGHLTETQLRQLVELLNAARQPHEDAEHPWPKWQQ